MADDRPVEDPTEMVARLATELEDLKSTMLARLARRPTGDVEIAVRSTPKPGTLFLQGQIVSRAQYPQLWQWVQDNGLLMAGLFGPADGSTTFGLPNFAGRSPIGVGTLGTDIYALGNQVGAARPLIVAANLPAHTHPINGSGTHGHNGTTSTDGSHGGHVNGTTGQAGYAPTSDPSWTRVSSWGSDGSHGHGFGTSQNGDHDHGGVTGSSGAATPTGLDVRQPSVAINWAIWT